MYYMFSTLPPRTAIFIDHSNIFYAKYTVGWYLNIENLLEACRNNPNISFVGLYWAYNPKKLEQYNWSEAIKNRFKDSKYLIYFKPLESHGSKNKGNVDTEMGYDIAEYKDQYDHIVLMSGDGDFAHPLKKLMQISKTILICSTKGHISGLTNLSQQNPTQCRFLDFNNNHSESIELRSIVKDLKKWLAIDPSLQQFLDSASKADIQDLLDFMECLSKGVRYKKETALFFSIVDKNRFPIYKNIARWQREEKLLLANYLKVVLA